MCTACFLFFTSCEKGRETPKSTAQNDVVDAAKPINDEAEKVETDTKGDVPAVESEVAPEPNPSLALPYPPAAGYPAAGRPFFGGGGGGGGARPAALLCENGTSDCNDNNPCTIDSCDDSNQCQHVLDTSKSDFGSGEVDGLACTVGKCAEVNSEIVCFEQRREFLTIEIGCADSNQCTSDSCIESNANDNSTPKYDREGNRILTSTHICVKEVVNGSPCILETKCAIGTCMPQGSGMPDDEFLVECSDELAETIPQLVCPETDSDPCTVAACEDGVGCVVANADNGTLCDDSSKCTGTFMSPDNCQAGTCVGGEAVSCNDSNVCTTDSCDSALGCVYVANTISCDDGNACTTGETCANGICAAPPNAADGMVMCESTTCNEGYCDIVYGCKQRPLTGPYGTPCVTGYEFGICALGYLRCESGTETDMCEPIFRPGDKKENCINPNSQDDDCDGVVDDCDCPPETGTVHYVATNGSDSGMCLNGSPCATITYAISQAVSGDTIFIEQGNYGESNIAVNIDLLILGEAPQTTVVDGEGNGEVFSIVSSADVTICGITISGGVADDADLLIARESHDENERFIGSNNGGGVFIDVESSGHIISCVVEENTATENGGGIYSEGTLEVLSSSIGGNTAASGGGIYGLRSTEIKFSDINSNTCSVNGGGIASSGGSSNLVVKNSLVRENEGSGNGTPVGIGIYTSSGLAEITKSTIRDNTGVSGAAIYNNGSAVTINSSTFSNNTGSTGNGAVENSGGNMNITNSTLSGNTLTASNTGAALFNGEGTLNVFNSTITNNLPQDSEGSAVFASTASTINFQHSIVANQQNGSDCGSVMVGAIVSNGFNLESAQSCDFTSTGDLQDTDPMLGPLANNGGPTNTHALATMSPALNAGDTDCGVSVDQRGFPRPQPNPGNCDIGAFEHQPSDPSFTILP